MAAFKVGQRVRFVSRRERGGHLAEDGPPIGAEGTITRLLTPAPHDWECVVDMPEHQSSAPSDGSLSSTEYFFDFCMLSPILPPDEKADQFIERMKRLGREPVSDAPKVVAKERS